ncbi:MAG: type II toxin-antitoxin system RelE/ParE family toxin [Microlunatus sp.]
MWTVILLDEVVEWVESADEMTQHLVAAALDLLGAEGPTLGRPLVDRIKGSRLHNLKELRPGSSGRSEVRMLFAFDPRRQAVVLVAGDKAGNWDRWYRTNIPIAERRFEQHVRGVN